MTDRTNSDDLQPAPLPSNKKSLEFSRAVLKHSITPSKITDLVKGLRDMRLDVQICLTKLEATFQHVHTLYDIMNNGLTRIASRASILSTSTNLTVRIELADWLKKCEETWGSSIQRKPNPVSLPAPSQGHSILFLDSASWPSPIQISAGCSPIRLRGEPFCIFLFLFPSRNVQRQRGSKAAYQTFTQQAVVHQGLRLQRTKSTKPLRSTETDRLVWKLRLLRRKPGWRRLKGMG